MEVSTERGTSEPISAVAVLACAWPALLLAAACLLPFLDKPFNIDDPYFLMMAQQIVRHPAHPMDFSICWNAGPGDECRKGYEFASGNAMRGQVAQGYVLAPTVLAGAREWVAHLTQLVLAWIAIVAMTSLVLRFGWGRGHAIAGALLLVAVPPFLPMASTAMPDILATALALVAMERLAAWKQEHKWNQGAAAAIALSLAGFARPHLVLLLPLAAFFLMESTNPKEVLTQIRRKLWLWIPVFAGFGLLLVIALALREHTLSLSPAKVGLHWKLPLFLHNLLAFLLYFAFPIPLAACWLANRLRARRLISVAIPFAVATLPWLFGWYQPLGISLAIIGCSVLINLLWDALNRRDHTGIFLLLWLLIPLPIVFYAQLPMKYLLPCIPAAILLCFRLTDGMSLRFARAAAIVLIAASAAYSILILRSDAEFAEFGRDALYRLISPHVAAGERVWFPGQYWSYWYAPMAGATLTFPDGPQPSRGDLLVVDLLTDGDLAPLARFPHRTLVESVSHKYGFGRTMGAGVGLYDSGRGYWLWGFGESEKDRFEIWRID
ncbi:MAG TPA: hypothetical protein VGJ21_03675 [Terracidiphilus sp.]|jgi:hypothetical protein